MPSTLARPAAAAEDNTRPNTRESPVLADRSPKHTAPSSTDYTTVNMSGLSDDDEDWEIESRPEVVEAIMEMTELCGESAPDKAVDPLGVEAHQKGDAEVDEPKEAQTEQGDKAIQADATEVDHSCPPTQLDAIVMDKQDPALSAPIPARDSSSIGLPHIRDQAISLQQQITSLAQSLSAITKATTTGPQLCIDRAVFEESRLAYVEKEMPRLRTLNDNLRKANRRLHTEVGELKSQLQLAQACAALNALPGEMSRTSMGIDPAAVQELAIDLSTKMRTKNDVADALFALVDSSSPYPSAPEEVLREQLEPRERLRTLEGVLDVSLGRMEELERKVRVLADPMSSSPRTASGASVTTEKGFCPTALSTADEGGCVRSSVSGPGASGNIDGSSDNDTSQCVRNLELSKRFDGQVSGPEVWL